MNILKNRNIIALLLGMTFLIACDKETKEKEENQLEARKQKMEEKLKKIQADIDLEIDKLTAASVELAEGAKHQVNETISKLKGERRKVSELTKNVKEASKETFDDIERQTDQKYNEISRKVEQWSDDVKTWFETKKEKIEG